MEGSEGNLVRGEVCVSLKQLAETIERAEAALTPDELFSGVLAGLRRYEGLASPANCVGSQMCVNGVCLFDGNLRVMFVKSWLSSRGFVLVQMTTTEH